MQVIFDRSLVKTEAAASFLQLAGTDAGCKAFLGDPERFDENVRQSINNAHAVLRDSALKIGSLVTDPTRTEVQKHEAARSLAEKTVAHIQHAKATVTTRASILYSDANLKAEADFAPSPSRAGLESEIRGWFRDQAKLVDGPMKIREAVLADKNVAAVMYHSPNFLVGISDAMQGKLRFDALEHFLPGAYKMMEESVALNELAPKFDMATKSVERSFYNGAVADQAKLRVSVD